MHNLLNGEKKDKKISDSDQRNIPKLMAPVSKNQKDKKKITLQIKKKCKY